MDALPLLIAAMSAFSAVMILAGLVIGMIDPQPVITYQEAETPPSPGACAIAVVTSATRDFGFAWRVAGAHANDATIRAGRVRSYDGPTIANGTLLRLPFKQTTLFNGRRDDGRALATADLVGSAELDPGTRRPPMSVRRTSAVAKCVERVTSVAMVTCVAIFASSVATVAAAIEPPRMPRRAIAPPTTAPPGRQVDVVDGDCKTVLFVPPGYAVPADGRVDLVVQFHLVPWFAIDEHLRHGLAGPILVVQLGEGSSTYARPFQDVDRFGRLLSLVEQQLGESAHVATVDVASFSAGYGAVREILKQDRYVERIRRVVLCDSCYAGWDPATTQPGATSRPASENMRPWAKFVELAAAGKKTFVLTHSSVQTPYANTQATADWLAADVGATFAAVPPYSTPAASDVAFPLYRRADVGHFHVWSYGGDDAQAHLTHVRHLADVWRALDDAGE